MARADTTIPARVSRGRLLIAALLAVLCLPALLPMFPVPAWQSHDGLHHIFRLADFDATLRAGNSSPRWLDGLGFGYGFPVTHYYAPLAYYLGAIARELGSGFLDAIKALYALAFIGTALGAYGLARSFMGRAPATLAALAYAYYPYHLADLYMRGTLTEFVALAFLPPLTWSARRLLSEPLARREAAGRVALFAALLAALTLTHNLTASVFLPALGLYLLLRYRGDLLRHAAYPLLGTALGFGLCAFYWLPALLETGWIRAGQVSGEAEITTLLTPVARFVSGEFWHAYMPDAPAQLQHPVGLVMATLSVVAALAVALRRGALDQRQRRAALAWFALAGATAFAITELSAPMWAAVRPLSLVQFPFRLHAVLGLALAMGIGLGAEALMATKAASAVGTAGRGAFVHFDALRTLVASAAIFLLIVSPLGALSLTPQVLPGNARPLDESQVNAGGMAQYDFQTALWTRLYGGVWLFEYMPAWVSEAREEFFLPRTGGPSAAAASIPPRTGMAVESYAPEARVLRVTSDTPFRLSFHTFFFPPWRARVDDVPAPTYPSGALGLLSADVPAGSHRVTLEYGATPARRIGEWLSIVAFSVWLALTAWRRRAVALGILLLCMAVAVAIGAAKPSPVAPVEAEFEAQVSLVGYRSSAADYRRGDSAEITLFWFARADLAENYKVFVHLDGAGTRIGQADSQPGFNFTPTTRWQTGELFADTYQIAIKPDAPPGEYDIYAGMYRTQPVRNLSVVSPAATADGRVRLGTLKVRP